jgi:tungstate transport system permease protein
VAFVREVLGEAWRAIVDGIGGDLGAVVGLTLWIAVLATAVAIFIGVPLGTVVGLHDFRGKRLVMLIVNTGMGLPPVIVGLVLLLLLWRDGPLGAWEILFTPAAMVLAQVILAVPIAIGLTSAAVGGLSPAVTEQLAALRLGSWARGRLVVVEVWPAVAGAVAASFGRVISEVGAVLIVGGNIRGETRVLTTAIVQEARQAQFGQALAFGFVLLGIALIVNGGITWLQLRKDSV